MDVSAVHLVKETLGVVMLSSMIIGQLIGITSAIYYWNDPEKESVDIFYMLATYWIVAPLAACFLLPFVIMYTPVYLIGKLRKVN